MIAITGHGEDTDRRRAQAAGFNGLIVKPLDLNNLVCTLRHVGAGSAAPEPRPN